MLHAVVYIAVPGVPAPIGFSEAAGMPGDIRFDFKTQANLPFAGIADWYPQLVLRPFTKSGAYGYDIVIDDPTGASGLATIPGSVMNDEFHMEMYSRNADLQPQGMIAYGRHTRNGFAYQQSGPLAPATYSAGPVGPQGDQGERGLQGDTGEPGMRGSRWYSGAGPPGALPDDRVDGDMYLDESNGDVWRWTAAALWARFRGM